MGGMEVDEIVCWQPEHNHEKYPQSSVLNRYLYHQLGLILDPRHPIYAFYCSLMIIKACKEPLEKEDQFIQASDCMDTACSEDNKYNIIT